MTRLPQRFYTRDTLTVARELLGQTLRHGEVRLRITEVEAYCGPDDSACHSRTGRTVRNAPMFGPAGHAYVYLCYGLHQMLNVVTGDVGVGEAVLIRACEPLDGISIVRRRRGGKSGPVLLTGPGKVAAALGLDQSFNNVPFYRAGGLQITSGTSPEAILAGPRVGIGYANPNDRDAPWRLAIAGTPWVSQPRGLVPFSGLR